MVFRNAGRALGKPQGDAINNNGDDGVRAGRWRERGREVEVRRGKKCPDNGKLKCGGGGGRRGGGGGDDVQQKAVQRAVQQQQSYEQQQADRECYLT